MLQNYLINCELNLLDYLYKQIVMFILYGFGCWPYGVCLLIALICAVVGGVVLLIPQLYRYRSYADDLFVAAAIFCVLAFLFLVFGLWLCGGFGFRNPGVPGWLAILSALLIGGAYYLLRG